MAYPQVVDPLNEPGAQPFRGLLADRHRDGYRHAAFAGAAVAGADQRVDGLVEVRVGHHDHVVLGTAEALRALAVGCGIRVDVVGDVGAADEADRFDVGVVQDSVDGLLVAVHDLEHAGRQAGLDEQLGQPHRDRRVTLRRLEHECISASEGGTGLPQRDHRREVERGDAGDHAQGLAQRIHVDARTGAFAVLAFEQVRDPDAELDHLDTALDVAARVGHRLAVLKGQQLGQLVVVVVDQLDESHHYPRAPLWIPCGPVFLGLDGRGHRSVDVSRRGHRNFRLHLTGAGVEDISGTGGLACDALPIDEVRDLCGHGCPRMHKKGRLGY